MNPVRTHEAIDSSPTVYKTCPACHISQPTTSFYRNKSKRDGLQSQCRSCFTAYQVHHGERRRAYFSEYRRNNRARRAKTQAAWRRTNRTRKATADAIWRRAHPERARKHAREWARRNPEWVRAKYERRRAAKQNVLVTLTLQEWEVILLSRCGSCVYCGSPEGTTQDHVIPISRGGAHTRDNVVPCCRPCNSRKHARLLNTTLALPI